MRISDWSSDVCSSDLFALLIWLTLFFVALHWKTQSRAALYGILHALTQRQILYVLGFLACYVTACIWLLSSVGWWQISNLKTTLLWTTTFIRSEEHTSELQSLMRISYAVFCLKKKKSTIKNKNKKSIQTTNATI